MLSSLFARETQKGDSDKHLQAAALSAPSPTGTKDFRHCAAGVHTRVCARNGQQAVLDSCKVLRHLRRFGSFQTIGKINSARTLACEPAPVESNRKNTTAAASGLVLIGRRARAE